MEKLDRWTWRLTREGCGGGVSGCVWWGWADGPQRVGASDDLAAAGWS